MSIRIYLDFDGVINILNPGPHHGETRQLADDVIISEERLAWLKDISNNPEYEIIWISHREEDVYFYTDKLGIPRHQHLIFTDHTGSKVSDIIKHYTENPCYAATVHEDSLTSQEIDRLLDEYIDVIMYYNALVDEIFRRE